jgi:hypothetical protein
MDQEHDQQQYVNTRIPVQYVNERERRLLSMGYDKPKGTLNMQMLRYRKKNYWSQKYLYLAWYLLLLKIFV